MDFDVANLAVCKEYTGSELGFYLNHVLYKNVKMASSVRTTEKTKTGLSLIFPIIH